MARRRAYSTKLCGWSLGHWAHLHGSSVGLIQLTRCMRSLTAAKRYFPVWLVDLPPFHLRKIPSLGGLRTDPTLFLPLFSTKITTPNATNFPLSPLLPTTANVCLCLVCVLPNFPLLGISEFLFGVVRLGVYQETPLCARVSDTTLESEVDTFDQRRFGAPHPNFVKSWS
jgi:hypothetical protein